MAQKWAHWLHNPCCLGGVPNALEQGTKSVVAHKWAFWLHDTSRLGVPGALEQGPNQHWPKSGQIGYITPGVTGGGGGLSPRLHTKDEISNGPTVGRLAT